MKQPQSSSNKHVDTQPAPKTNAQLVQMLSGLDARAGMATVQRTRRVVMGAVYEMRDQRSQNRRNVAIAALTIVVLATVLTPAIWSSVDDFLGGEHFSDLPSMVMMLIVLLFSAMLGALIVGLRQIGAGRR